MILCMEFIGIANPQYKLKSQIVPRRPVVFCIREFRCKVQAFRHGFSALRISIIFCMSGYRPVGLFPLRLGETPIATRQPDHRSCCHYETAQGEA